MQFFVTLFISSTGLVLSPVFLMHHLPILAAGALTVMISKTVLVSVWWHRLRVVGQMQEQDFSLAAAPHLHMWLLLCNA